MAGRPRKPTHLKVISGTERKDRTPPTGITLPTLNETPKAPGWLPNAHAVKEWNRLTPILTANKLLTAAGLSALGMLCALHGKLVQLYSAGESPNSAMLGQYRGLINDFGLTPVAQGKVRPAAHEEEANPFARNGTRPH